MSAAVHALHVHVGSEQGYATVYILIGFHAFEDGLGIV